MLTLAYIAYAILGVCAGVIAGLLGVGGGVITVPALFFLFTYQGMPPEYTMHMAIATSLSAMLLNTLSSTRSQNKRGSVVWNVVAKSAIGLTIGSILGALIADLVPTHPLKILFGLFLCGIGLVFLRHKKPHLEEHSLPSIFWLCGLFSGVGTISIMLGLSGGVFAVPLLTAFKMSPKKAIGTASAMAFIMTVIGSLTFLWLGMKQIDVPYAWGYIYVPAWIIIALTSACSAPLGVHLAHQLSDRLLRRIFGIALGIVGITMLW